MTALELAGGIGLGAAAAACFDGAVALQAVEARALPAGGAGAGLLRGLLARPRWLAATALAAVGWPLQLGALALAPLTVVQPTLALGLIVLLALGMRLLGEPATARDLLAVVGIAAGLALLAWAAPEPSHVHARAGLLAAVLGGLAALTALPWALRAHAPGALLVLAAGCGNAAAGVTTKLLADALGEPAALAAVGWACATAAVAALALVDEMGALQRVGAARVAAGAFALQTVIPVLAAPVLTGEGWTGTPLGGGAILAGLLLVVGCALVLGSATAVKRLVTAAQHAGGATPTA
jgi:hypothetical protein